MAISIQVPSLGSGFAERFRITRWHAAPRQKIAIGEILVTMESKDAVFEMEAFDPGELEILVPEGKFVSVGETIAILHEA